MSYENITTDEQLRQYCRDLAQAPTIGFDTEFVAEHTFRPVLCLVQVCSGNQLAVIDPLAIEDMTPFWQVVSQPGHQTVVHAGRGESEFCLQAVGHMPADLFDVQIAAGLIGMEYPAGYGNLIARLLGQNSKKQETRTDWRRRPLTQRQIDYALDDVRHLQPLRELLVARLTELNRLDWMRQEMTAWQEELHRSLTEERWWRVSGNASLSNRGLAIVRELWRWRQDEAERRDKPPRTILRDDLIVELARRQSADVKQIQAIRGMEWGKLRTQIPKIAEAIQRGLSSPEREHPTAPPRENVPQLAVLGQFLSAALGALCRQRHVAASLVGGPSDVRDLILYRTNPNHAPHRAPPLLSRGWRSEVVGMLFDDLLAGRMSIRVADPLSEQPLVVEPAHQATQENRPTGTA